MRPQKVWAPSASEREALRRIVDAEGSETARARRASAVLLAAQGLEQREIADQVGLAPPTVARWVERYRREGIGGLADRPRRRKKIVDEIAAVDRELLVSWMGSERIPEDVRRRARAMVLLADGVALKDICRTVGVSGPILWKWRNRYREHGVDGLCPRASAHAELEVPASERTLLERWAGDLSGNSAVPARIILMAAEGRDTQHIATCVGRSPTAVRNWLRKYREGGLNRISPEVAMRPPTRAELSWEDREIVARWLERPDVLVDEDAVRRARAVQLVAEGVRIKDIAGRLHVQPGSVGEWLRRYRRDGVAGLATKHGGRRPKHGPIALPALDRDVLESWANSTVLKTPVIRRARAVLLTADGESPSNTAVWSRMSPSSVVKWVDRYLVSGLDALFGPEPGANAEIDEPKLVLTTLEPPDELAGLRTWNPEALTRLVRRVSPTTVAKTWSRWGLRPSHPPPWRFASAPKIPITAHEVVGLYLNPPDRVLALSPGGVSAEELLDLRAALRDAAPRSTGTGDERWHERHLRFLQEVRQLHPRRLRLICEPGGAQQHPRVVEWRTRHPELSVHLPPSSVSWRNFVTAWFGIVARRFRDAEAALALAVLLVSEVSAVPTGAEFDWIASGRAGTPRP